MNHTRSHALFTRASELIPGGVNSPVRAFKSVGLEPVFIKRASGAYILRTHPKTHNKTFGLLLFHLVCLILTDE